MKGLFAGILTILIFLGTFKEAAIYLSFKINQTYIAENLCVEKDIEESTCGGCCQLKEKIKETRQEDSKNLPERQREKTQPITFFVCTKIDDNLINKSKQMVQNSCTMNQYSFQHCFDIFRPPKF